MPRQYCRTPDGGGRPSLVALVHGTNDAQKTMGIITLLLISSEFLQAGSGPAIWVIVSCASAIAAGTYASGWRIIRTLGRGLTEVKPAQGFAAETSTAAAILASSNLGFALSTTQVASGSVAGCSRCPPRPPSGR
jgi:inorganic phosphate transporter, PiT family